MIRRRFTNHSVNTEIQLDVHEQGVPDDEFHSHLVTRHRYSTLTLLP
jgi:hypothetical protein